jgi:HEAT repeat protein
MNHHEMNRRDMNKFPTLSIACVIAVAFVAVTNPAFAQADDDELKFAAIEALITAPPERAMPIVQRVLASDASDELKSRALFVLSQIDTPEAQTLLVDSARSSSGELQAEAIRMIGIGGNDDALAELNAIYANGDAEVREAVLEAYLIAGDEDAVYRIAIDAQDPDAYEEAVEMLGAMGATDKLRELREQRGVSDALIEAYLIAGDLESLELLAADNSDPAKQLEAIEALGAAGGKEAGPKLAEIYRGADSDDVREAALEGILISGNDEVMLELFRAADDTQQKREILEMLVIMDSDAVWDVIDQTLENGQ